MKNYTHEALNKKCDTHIVSTFKIMDNKTTFYTERFMELVIEIEGIVQLNKGDNFLGKNGQHYTITWKVYNPFLNIMIYHGKLTVEALS